MGLLDLKTEAFGMDLSESSLKIAKLKRKRNGFVLTTFNETKIGSGVIDDGVIKDEAALAKIIRLTCNGVRGQKLRTKYVVASLPEKKSFLQVIQMPKMSEEELESAVPFEAENYIPMPIDDVYLDFQVISPIKDYLSHLEVLLAATPKKIVDSYVSSIKKAGLVPIGLEIESESIARALVKNEVNSSPLILVDFGEDQTDFIVFSGNSIRFTSTIPISSQQLTKAISESLKVNFSEAEKIKIEYGLLSAKKDIKAERVSRILAPILDDLSRQIKKYINFYYDHSSYEYLLPGKKIEKILLCGGGAELRGLTDALSKKLDIHIEIGNPLVNFMSKNPKSVIKKDLTSFTTAIGLALRGTVTI